MTRVAKLIDSQHNTKLIRDHGRLAVVLSIEESATGMQARLKFPDGFRTKHSVKFIRILQDT